MTPLIDVAHIAKAYREVQALNDCSVSVEAGQLVGFLGPNGAGKTTAMRAIMQLVNIDSGTIRWNG